jgi:hypothetical protein
MLTSFRDLPWQTRGTVYYHVLSQNQENDTIQVTLDPQNRLVYPIEMQTLLRLTVAIAVWEDITKKIRDYLFCEKTYIFTSEQSMLHMLLPKFSTAVGPDNCRIISNICLPHFSVQQPFASWIRCQPSEHGSVCPESDLVAVCKQCACRKN